MITARLLIAADKYVVRRFKVERFDLIAELPALGNQVADRFCIEEFAAAHVHRHRNEGSMKRRFLDGFHHAEHHIRRQIIHAECAHIFQIAVDGRFARAAQACYHEKTHDETPPLLRSARNARIAAVLSAG